MRVIRQLVRWTLVSRWRLSSMRVRYRDAKGTDRLCVRERI